MYCLQLVDKEGLADIIGAIQDNHSKSRYIVSNGRDDSDATTLMVLAKRVQDAYERVGEDERTMGESGEAGVTAEPGVADAGGSVSAAGTAGDDKLCRPSNGSCHVPDERHMDVGGCLPLSYSPAKRFWSKSPTV